MTIEPTTKDFICPSCKATLPGKRQDFPWCECGWNLPADPLKQMHGLPRLIGRVNRALGHWQDNMDARWLQKNPVESLSWSILSGVIYLIGLISIFGTAALYVGAIGLALFGVAAIPQNCLMALIPLAISLPLLYFWRPYASWFQRTHVTQLEIYESVLKTARGLAKQLGLAPPAAFIFSPWPEVYSGAAFRLLPYPHIERYIRVGMPFLSVLSMTELKVLMARAMATSSGARGLFLPSIGKAFRLILQLFDRVSSGILDLAIYLFFVSLIVGLVAYAPWFILGRVSVSAYASSLALNIAAGAALLLLITTGLVWLAATWFRRAVLLADRNVAWLFGRNSVLHTELMGRLVKRTFEQDLPRLMNDARSRPPEGDIFTEFRRMWKTMSPEHREKCLRELAIEYPELLYFESTLKARAELLKGVPDKPMDDLPASQLLPDMRLISRIITDFMFH